MQINWNDPNLLLGDDRHKWGLAKDPAKKWVTSQSFKSHFRSISKDDVIQQLWSFPPQGIESPIGKDQLDVTSDLYKKLGHGLAHIEMPDSPEKEELRRKLYGTDEGVIKFFVDYSVAKREFARQIYSYSELAQRAGGENELWFCMEYAECLEKLFPIDAKLTPKDDVIHPMMTDWIRAQRKKLKSAQDGDPIVSLTLDDLIKPDRFNWDAYIDSMSPRPRVKEQLTTIVKRLKEGVIDWRFFIVELLVEEAIALVADAEGGDGRGKDLASHIRQFLNAMEHFNNMTKQYGRYTYVTRLPRSRGKV